MALVTPARYRKITGDETSEQADVVQALTDAVDALQEALGGRLLKSAERTEAMRPDSAGRLYPLALPVTAVVGGYTIDGATLIGSSPFPPASDLLGGSAGVAVTYTGGYVERSDNPTAANRLPAGVERDLAWAAYRMLRPSEVSQVPVGATAVRLGDAAVTYDRARPAGTVQWSRETLRLRRRRV